MCIGSSLISLKLNFYLTFQFKRLIFQHNLFYLSNLKKKYFLNVKIRSDVKIKCNHHNLSHSKAHDYKRKHVQIYYRKKREIPLSKEKGCHARVRRYKRNDKCWISYLESSLSSGLTYIGLRTSGWLSLAEPPMAALSILPTYLRFF